jgi:flavin-dependent dehydrogenase
MKDIDLIIIGSGPAGISTALHLLEQDPGWARRMFVLEKAIHPRQKLCGGGMTRPGVKKLRRLGVQIPLPIPQKWVDDVRYGH